MATTFELKGVGRLEKIGKNAKKIESLIKKNLNKASSDFANKAIRSIKEDYLTGPRPSKLGVKSDRLRSSIRFRIKDDDKFINISFGTDIIYAAIHEFGGVTHPEVTDKMRAWAWAKFFKTGNELFKGIALTKKDKLTIKIKKRPFMQPGVEDNIPWFRTRIKQVMLKSIGELTNVK